MVTLVNTFCRIRPFRALVLGDFMLDVYTTGKVKRISPEAPVPVMEVVKQESRPGGAGNAVLNFIALGAEVAAMGRVGSDVQGQELKRELKEKGVDVRGLFIEPGYQTPLKNRLIADSQQLLRVDVETILSVTQDVEREAINYLEAVIFDVQVVAISDYAKGFLSNRLIAEAIRIAKLAHIPVIIDPKGADFTKYRGATLIKPNLSEAYAAAKLPHSSQLEDVAQNIFTATNVEFLLITRSEAGISLFDQKGRSDFSVNSREVKDVTGAGDTVLAMIGLGMANGLELSTSVQLANIAAGIAIERLGCVQVHLSEVAQRLLETDCYTKIFDENHMFVLKQVLRAKRYSLLVLDKGQSMTTGLYQIIRNLSKKGGRQLVFYVRDSHPNDDFIHLLSSHHDVRAIILQTESLKNLCEEICPEEVLFLEGEQLQEARALLTTLMTPVH